MTTRIVIDLDRDGWTKNLQLNIATLDENDRGMGFRLAGPKYNGSSKNLLRTELDERDAAEIRAMLDATFPLAAVLSPAEILHQAARLMEVGGYSDDAVNWLDTYADWDPAGNAAVPSCARCSNTGIDPDDSDPASGPTHFSMGEPPALEPCRNCGPGAATASPSEPIDCGLRLYGSDVGVPGYDDKGPAYINPACPDHNPDITEAATS